MGHLHQLPRHRDAPLPPTANVTAAGTYAAVWRHKRYLQMLCAQHLVQDVHAS